METTVQRYSAGIQLLMIMLARRQGKRPRTPGGCQELP